MKIGHNVKETHLSRGGDQHYVWRVLPASSRLPAMGDEALREVVYRAIFGALLYLNFCQCEN